MKRTSLLSVFFLGASLSIVTGCSSDADDSAGAQEQGTSPGGASASDGGTTGTDEPSSGGSSSTGGSSSGGTESSSPSTGGTGTELLTTPLFESLRLELGLCLPGALSTNSDTTAACELLEARIGLDCSGTARTEASANARTQALEYLEATGACGGTTGVTCDDYGVCALTQITTDECRYDETDGSTATTPGWCYINDPQSPLVSDCAPEEAAQVRVVGANLPESDSRVFLSCP